MKLFITGGTGFIGSHLVARLAAEGHDISCLVRTTSRTDHLEKAGVKRVYGDVNDRRALLEGMQGCDCLFHLANLYSMWLPDPSAFERVNVDGTRCVLEAALEAGVKRVVYVSSVAVYGKPAERPFREESTPSPEVYSEYARTKRLGDQIARDLCQNNGLPLVSLYPGIVLGPGDDKPSGQYIQDLIFGRVPSVIFSHSSNTYVAVDDVVEALIRAAEMPDLVGSHYLIGKETYNGLDYVRMICRIARTPMPLFRFPDGLVCFVSGLLEKLANLTHRPPWWGFSLDAAHTLQTGFVFDGSKAERELGLRYTPVEDALRAAIDFYRARRR